MTRKSKYCEKCGGETEIYYGPWCPVCDRPSIKQQPTLNFLQVVRHLERKYPDILDDDHLEGHGRSLWLLIMERIENDSYIKLDFKTWYEEADGNFISYDGIDYSKGFLLMKMIIDEYESECEDVDNILWGISW